MKNLKKTNPKRFLCLLLTLVMLSGILPLSAVTAVAASTVTGYGTAASPYVVRDYDGLKNILEGSGSAGLAVTYVELGADISTVNRNGGFGIAAGETVHINGCVDLNLNGKTATLYTKGSLNSFIEVQGILKIRNTGLRGTGKLLGKVDNTGKPTLVTVSDGGFLTVESGEVELYSYIGNSMTTVHIKKGGTARFDNGVISYNAFDDSIYGEERNGGFEYQDYALKMDLGSTVMINNGTFKGRVLCNTERVASADAPKQLTVNGGSFTRSVYFNFETYDRNMPNIPVVINGGTFSWDVDGVVDGRYIPSSNEKGYDTMRLFQFVGYSSSSGNDPDHMVEKAFALGSVIHAESNARLKEVAGAESDDKWLAVTDSSQNEIFSQLKPRLYPGYGYGNYCMYSPVTVIPNASGIKDVTLNGVSVLYTHNSPYAPVYDVRRDEQNTLVFSWYDLPSAMKAAGYSYSYSYRVYENNKETVSDGTVRPTTVNGVSSWSHGIPYSYNLNSYVIYLRLDLMKDGKLVNTATHDEYIVRLNCTENIVNLTRATLTMPNGDLKPDVYYGKPGESNIVTVPDGVKYSVSSQTDWSGTLANANHFKEKNAYTKTVVLRAAAGYNFSSACTASLSGAPSAEIVGISVSADRKTLTVRIRATCVTVLRTATGTLTGFEQGLPTKNARVISSEPEKYDIEIFYVAQHSESVTEPSVFKKYGNYKFGLKVVPKPGYGFLESVYGTVNLLVKMDENYLEGIQTVTASYKTSQQVGSSTYSGNFFETDQFSRAPSQTFDRLDIICKNPVAGEASDDKSYSQATVSQQGFSSESVYWCKKNSIIIYDGIFNGGQTYTCIIKVKVPWYMRPAKNGDSYAFTVGVNGKEADKCSFEYNAKLDTGFVYAHYTVSVPGSTVSGTVKSFGSQTDEVIVQLFENSASEPSYETVVKGNNASYSIANVAIGTYTMKVMKKNHADRVYFLSVGTENVKQNAELWLYGDVTFDGNVDITDAMAVFYHVAKKDELSEDALTAADFDFNGTTDISDAMALFYFVAKKIDSLFG